MPATLRDIVHSVTDRAPARRLLHHLHRRSITIALLAIALLAYLRPQYMRYVLHRVQRDSLRVTIALDDLIYLSVAMLVGYLLLRRAVRVHVTRTELRLMDEALVQDTAEYASVRLRLGATCCDALCGDVEAMK